MPIQLVKKMDQNDVEAIEPSVRRVYAALGWDEKDEFDQQVDLDLSIFALDSNGKVRNDDDVVFYNAKYKGNISAIPGDKSFFNVLTDSSKFPDSRAKIAIDSEEYIPHPSGSIIHRGDDLIGGANEEGSNEEVYIDFDLVPNDIEKIAIVASIYPNRRFKHPQFFENIKNAFIFSSDIENSSGFAVQYDLNSTYKGASAVILGEFCRRGSNWEFQVLEKEFSDGLGGICDYYGVEVE